ncbi:hypothetical protein FNV43_RR09966 [Rhamnella rubrinervis]|uniref:Uncharacterized protein n=1 Tax=Rhamnella rubrinervis TaxID=2594499 RepID=A0A8K0HBR5_9ROSA|nr:hypothetical protein FNV43_RR09966 [Rhamnella rubrinervis]
MQAQHPPCDGEQSLEKRPGILFIGSSNVGKRTLLSRLVSEEFEDASESSSEVLLRGWTINTKYYTADISISVAHLRDGFSITTIPTYTQLAALVMVFDMTDPLSLVALKECVSCNDLQNFEILLCIGNKVDLVPGHPAHSEYRRHLLKVGESDDSHLEFTDYGISETEGSSLLGDDEYSWETRRSCLEWCTEHNIEYIEACASNADFDKCLSVDGDSQGVERLFGALSANMWPGMTLKSGDKITEPSLPEKEVLSDEESEDEVEYEILSGGSAEQWDDADIGWVSANGLACDMLEVDTRDNPVSECNIKNGTRSDKEELQPLTSMNSLPGEIGKEAVPLAEEPNQVMNRDESSEFDFEELEKLMSEIGNMRDSLRLMPDFQRREMAAKLALKMASMFGGGSDDEEEI